MTVRLFAAIYPPSDIAARLHADCAPMRAAAPTLRWTPAEQLHGTVRFFGTVEASLVPAIADAIAESCRLFDPISAAVRGIGAFPVWGRARVVWAGLAAEPKLELLHHEIERRAMALGFEVEGRIFRPHLTLARLPDTPNVGLRRAIREAARGVRVRHDFTIHSVALVSSAPGPAGRVHQRVAQAPLGRH